jgi:NAD(P)-dependent dehydrogenase (short-subunit alcohol dehydrogenase family)
MKRFQGRVAIITGVASGIGLATAERLAAEGASVAGIDIGRPPDDDWARIDADAPGTILQEADIRDEEAIAAAVAAIVERFGRIDILVNSAGVVGMGPAHLLPLAEFERIVDINLKGSFIISKHVLPTMLEQKSGNIVLVASVEGIMGLTAHVAYNASKGGVVMMAKTLAIDYAPAGIRVNCVCPGGVDTAMTAMLHDEAMHSFRDQLRGFHAFNRFSKPEEIAAAILFLASDDASFVTGSAFVVDGGFTAGHQLKLG